MSHFSINTWSKNCVLICCILLASCDRMLNVEPRRSTLSKDAVFSNDITAHSAVMGIYGQLYLQGGFASGSQISVSALAGLSADEFQFGLDDAEKESFVNNTLRPDNASVLSLWKSMYVAIYNANSALEGLQASSGVTPTAKTQLTGECLFVRAFCYFYLVNLYSGVPIVTTTSFEANESVKRASEADVYAQITRDLEEAYTLLSDEYPSEGRVRPNKSAVAALLARVHLYQQHWQEAERYATEVIDNSKYELPALATVFLNTSREAIWQLMPEGRFNNTNEGALYILIYEPIYYDSPFSLKNSILQAFEPNDARRAEWINSFASASTTYYYPFKYKIKDGGTSSPTPVPLTEYSMVLRLAEQYLIRAEARAQQDNLSGAISDIDKVRDRADLPLIADTDPGISQAALLLAIEHERLTELFSEWGHRWFDLKRTGRADAVLGSKPEWESTAVLYPIPQNEINKNPAFGDQNDGY